MMMARDGAPPSSQVAYAGPNRHGPRKAGADTPAIESERGEYFGESCCRHCPTRPPLVTSAGSGIGRAAGNPGAKAAPLRPQPADGRGPGLPRDQPDSDRPAARAYAAPAPNPEPAAARAFTARSRGRKP